MSGLYAKAALLAAMGLGLSACEEPGASASRSTFTIPITDGFGTVGVSWRGNRGGYSGVYRSVDRDGGLYICGAGYFEGFSRRSLTLQAQATRSFQVNGVEVYRGTRHFTEYANAEELANGVATCRGTGTATPEGRYRVTVEALKTRFRL